MTNKADNAYAEAKELLVYYMRESWTNAGLKWGNDNTAEVENIVECIKMGIKEQIKAEEPLEIRHEAKDLQ